MQFLTDLTTVRLDNLPTNVQVKVVLDLLAGFRVTIPPNAITTRLWGQFGSTALIKFANSASAHLVLEGLKDCLGRDRCEMSAKVVPTITKHEGHMELRAVSVVWRRPCRMATLQYKDYDSALMAAEFLRTNRPQIMGRLLSVIGVEDNSTLEIDCLHPDTQPAHIEAIFTTALVPARIEMKGQICTKSDERMSRHVGLIRVAGSLEYFGFWKPRADDKYLRATAVFSDRESAMRAVQDLNGRRIEILGNCRLSVYHKITVTYFVSFQIARAIRSLLDSLHREIRDTHNVFIKTHVNADGAASSIKVWGEVEKSVAKVNASVEKIIQGDVMLNGESPLWDNWFASADGLTCIKKVAGKHNVHIYRELQSCRLRLFGGTVASKLDIERALITAMESLTMAIHTVTLNQDMLRNTTARGAWAKLHDKFGNAVSLDHSGGSASSPAIILYGSQSDLQGTRAIVQHGAANPAGPKPGNCSVCWCPAEEPLELSCGHAYCRECFYKAADSAVENPPFGCLGGQGKCARIFGIRELVETLPYGRFETLLKAAFNAYVRKHPEELRYCPTADCPSLYRPTKMGSIFSCARCISTICTTCHVPEHSSITCRDWKENHADGGTKALQQYRKNHDVRDCPKCKSAIEKDEGCMHIHCGSCRAHICWFCMMVFDDGSPDASAECYDHMSIKHGGIYDPAELNYDDDSDDEDELDEVDEGEVEDEEVEEVEDAMEVQEVEHAEEAQEVGDVEIEAECEADDEWEDVEEAEEVD